MSRRELKKSQITKRREKGEGEIPTYQKETRGTIRLGKKETSK